MTDARTTRAECALGSLCQGPSPARCTLHPIGCCNVRNARPRDDLNVAIVANVARPNPNTLLSLDFPGSPVVQRLQRSRFPGESARFAAAARIAAPNTVETVGGEQTQGAVT